VKSNPVEFLYHHLGQFIGPVSGGVSDFLKKAVLQRTKKVPTGAPMRLGPSGCVMMASSGDSVVIAPLVGIRQLDKLKVFDPGMLPEGVKADHIVGAWLWRVEAPFIWAEQGKSCVLGNLRVSQSLPGGQFCSTSGIEAFDLVFCRRIAQAILDLDAAKVYREYIGLRNRRREIDLNDQETKHLLDAVNKKIIKIEEKHKYIERLNFPWPESMEMLVLHKLIASKEVGYA